MWIDEYKLIKIRKRSVQRFRILECLDSAHLRYTCASDLLAEEYSSGCECYLSSDFSAQMHLKSFGRDIDPPYMIGHCTGCRRLFVYILRGLPCDHRSFIVLAATHLPHLATILIDGLYKNKPYTFLDVLLPCLEWCIVFYFNNRKGLFTATQVGTQ